MAVLAPTRRHDGGRVHEHGRHRRQRRLLRRQRRINLGSGFATIAANGTANQNVCVLFTTTNSPTVNAHVSYVQQ